MVTILYYVGIALIIWLSIGFLVGIKVILWDRSFKEQQQYCQESLEKEELSTITKTFFKIVYQNQWNFLVLCTLMGLAIFIMDWISVFKANSD